MLLIGKESTLYQNNKILDWSKLRAFEDEKTNVNEKLKFHLQSVEDIVRKRENTDYQNFFPFPTMFLKSALFQAC